MRCIKEWLADISPSDKVFYNPKMSKLRDLSVLFLKARVNKEARLLDCTAASGIRGIRYALEAGIKDVTLLDINKDAARSAKLNVKRNGLKQKVINDSIQHFANSLEDAFDVIDLDPFGTPVPYVHDLLKLCKDNTLMMITATDTATLCGAESKACVKLYGSKPIHNELCHEGGVRILLNYISREAAQFNFSMEPALCIADLHYMRVFVFLRRGAERAYAAIKTNGFVTYCPHCCNFAVAKGIVPKIDTKCGNCGRAMDAYGPMWLGSLQDKETVARMLDAGSKGGYSGEALKLLGRINDEVDTPFFYSVSKIASHLKTSSAPLEEIVQMLKKTHAAGRTHFEPDAIKTDATVKEVIADVKKINKARDRRPSRP
ncbi:tRNA (guanine(26)-N(2))-dimethyltransferase [uncultured archaeon]|nr:tRNA (guanine(26)-N(2))-dimethyltransferase [uncultured archaeon]